MNTSSTITVTGSGTPVVALHSSMSSKSQWSRLFERLAPDYKCIATDLSGYGKAAFPRNPADFSLHDEAAMVDDAVVKAIGRNTPFHLIGHSYGGGTALRLAVEQPRRILSLALYEPTPFCLLEENGHERKEIQVIIDTVARTTAIDARMATRIFIDYWNGAGSFDAFPAERQQAMVQRIDKANLDFRALITEPVTLRECGDLNLPVCLIAGHASPAPARRIVTLLHAALPNAIRYDIDAGHMGPITHADEVNKLLAVFIDHHERQYFPIASGF